MGALFILAAVMAVLAAGCIAADRLFPRIPIIEDMISRLPLGSEEKEDLS